MAKTKLTTSPIESLPIPDFTEDCIRDVKTILAQAKAQCYRSVNSVMVQAYWLVGWRIVHEEQGGNRRAGYGEQVIPKLAKALNHEQGSGMSVAQLWNCRQFYTVFPSKEILYTLCRELSWSHLRLIMRLDTEKERMYYVEQAKMGGWSVRELERNIRTDMFHRVVQNQLPESSIAPDTEKTNATQSKTIASQIKDPYILEFLGIKPEIHNTEKDLESAILSHIEKFLLELGKGFSFVERQMHIKTETQDFYIDLVFYNYILKCFVLIDLKTGVLKHQDIGQMDMYVRMFNDIRKADDDNPTVGIIFCSNKDDSIVKYSVLNDSEHLFASKYKLVLPTEDELAEELTRNRHRLEEFYKPADPAL